MNVGFFSFPRLVHGGGFEKYLLDLANALAGRGHRVSIVTASEKQYIQLQRVLNLYYGTPIGHDNSRLTTAELHERLDGPLLHEVPFRQMTARLTQCDVLYAKNEVLDLAVLAMLKKHRLPPIVCGVHTPMWYPRAMSRTARFHNKLYLGSTYRTLLRGVAAVHVSNSHDRKLFPRLHGIEPERVFHIPYPFRFDRGSASASKDPERLRVVFAGRLTEQKGIDILLQTIELLGAEDPDGFSFTIAGSGQPEWEEQLRIVTAKTGHVEYLGYVAHEQMAEFYASADVAFVPSSWETFPYACLEPQSQGVAVIASDIPGCQDIVGHGETGFLFPVGDAEAAAAALQRVRRLQVEAPGELARLGQDAIKSVRQHSDSEQVVDALEHMLESVARRR